MSVIGQHFTLPRKALEPQPLQFTTIISYQIKDILTPKRNGALNLRTRSDDLICINLAEWKSSVHCAYFSHFVWTGGNFIRANNDPWAGLGEPSLTPHSCALNRGPLKVGVKQKGTWVSILGLSWWPRGGWSQGTSMGLRVRGRHRGGQIKGETS